MFIVREYMRAQFIGPGSACQRGSYVNCKTDPGIGVVCDPKHRIGAPISFLL